jgi:uncharacterized protein (TIGR02421 family)
MNLTKIDREIAFWFKKINHSCTQPINVEQEKKKIFEDRTYDPQFKYNKHAKVPQIKNALRKLKADYSILGILLDQKRYELLKKLDMYENVGTKLFTDKSLEVYGKPDKELVKKARKFLDLNKEDKSMSFNTISSVKKFVDSLMKFGYSWKVVEKDMCVGARFNITEKTLYINKNRKFSENDLRRLIIHEIGTHIARAENAKKQRYKLFLIGFPDYIVTEEGLAVYNEEKAGLLTNDVLKNYAGRVTAVDLSLKNSFSTVYNELLEFFNKNEAFNLVLRAKRGIGNTSRPGANTKDHLYLKGKYIVENFVKNGGKLSDLYVGKIGVQHVKLIKEIK